MMENHSAITKLWTFQVICHPQYTEKVYITGDCDALGNWSTKNLIPLSFDKSNQVWFISVNIPADRDVHYRYFTCIADITNEQEKIKIIQWETNLHSREVKQEQIFNDSECEWDTFGVYDNIQKLENGWLIDDVAIYVRLTSKAIEWISEETNKRKTFIKLKRSQQGQTNMISKHNGSDDIILISTRNEDGKYCEQVAEGYSYYDTELAVFMTRTFTVDNQKPTILEVTKTYLANTSEYEEYTSDLIHTFVVGLFLASVLGYSPRMSGFVVELTDIIDGQPARNCCSYFVLENKFHRSTGSVKIPILSCDHEHVGNLKVEFLIVRAPQRPVNCTFKSSYAKYWNNSWTGLEIGHRGSGVSFGNSSTTNAKFRENTIGSFNSAGNYGADLVEFDVQLTKDLIPTIYHDFHVLLDIQNKMKSQRKKIFPFHKLNFEELKDFKIHHVKELNDTFDTFENDDEEEFSPFPSLEQVLNAVDPQIGFNIEIKYTCQLQDGSDEVDDPIDMNEYVDRILEVVYANAGRRYIVFSSFSPDICIMARLKQNKYPVMFLTQGVTKKYSPYADERMKNIQAAINFANSADLLGIVAHTEDLLKDYSLVKMIINCDLVLFCWGGDNNNKENIETLKKEGVHGIIFDRIDQFGQKLKKDTFSEAIL